MAEGGNLHRHPRFANLPPPPFAIAPREGAQGGRTTVPPGILCAPTVMLPRHIGVRNFVADCPLWPRRLGRLPHPADGGKQPPPLHLGRISGSVPPPLRRHLLQQKVGRGPILLLVLLNPRCRINEEFRRTLVYSYERLRIMSKRDAEQTAKTN